MINRDSLLLSVLFWVGLVVGVVFAAINLDSAGPAAYGIPPMLFKWLALANTILLAVSGKLSSSGLAGDKDPLSTTKSLLGVFSVKDTK